MADNTPATPSPSTSPQSDDNAASGLRGVDLIALDKDGRPVIDLRPEEPHLTLNKVEQRIESLAPAASEPLTIGLFFDVSRSRIADTHVEDETRLASEFLRAILHE